MKKLHIGLFVFLMLLSLTGCHDKALEEATAAVTAYNEAAESYNVDIVSYNDACVQIEQAVSSLDSVIDEAQTVINAGEEPYDSSTLDNLKAEISEAQNVKATPPVAIEPLPVLTIDSEAKTAKLKELKSTAESKLAEVNTLTVPSTPSIPDYSKNETAIKNALSVYQDSIQSLKQVTNPDQDFVMDRLQMIDTITEIEAVTEETDVNGHLNKQGGYTSAIYFRDTLVDLDKVYIEPGFDGLIDIGTDAGGCIEVFANERDVQNRDAYLAGFDGGILASGGHYIVGTVLIRTSNALTGTQQLELTDAIKESFLKVIL